MDLRGHEVGWFKPSMQKKSCFMSAVHVAKPEYDASGPAPAQGVPEARGSK